MSFYSGTKTVAVAGTAEALVAVKTMCTWAVIQPLAANTNNVYIGDSTVSSSNGIWLDSDLGQSLTIPESSAPLPWNLADIYVDVDTDGEGVVFFYGIV
jgi:hypothetical protein